MKIEAYIQNWKASGLVSQEQAEKMLLDVREKSKREQSGKFILALSTLGSLLLGVGVILFVAANWDVLPDMVKIAAMILLTLSSLYTGHEFRFRRKNLPGTGSALIFLSTLLFGASLFLIGQIYNVNANAPGLVLVWFICILPLVYLMQSSAVAALCCVLYYLWIGLTLMDTGFDEETLFILLPVIYLMAGSALLVAGNLHLQGNSSQSPLAEIIRSSGIKMALTCLFLLTFPFFSGSAGDLFFFSGLFENNIPRVLTLSLAALITVTGLSTLAFYRYRPQIFRKTGHEQLAVIIILMAVFFFLGAPDIEQTHTLIFNLLFFAACLYLVFRGYREESISMVNRGFFWLSLFILARYFDFFWDLMPRSLFFMAGGILLVGGGIYMEKKRRVLKNNFRGEAQ